MKVDSQTEKKNSVPTAYSEKAKTAWATHWYCVILFLYVKKTLKKTPPLQQEKKHKHRYSGYSATYQDSFQLHHKTDKIWTTVQPLEGTEHRFHIITFSGK